MSLTAVLWPTFLVEIIFFSFDTITSGFQSLDEK